MRVGIYARVSTEEQAREGFSISAQREKLTSYVHSQDWEIYGYYIDEGVSAKNTDRPELQRLLQDIKERKLDVVLVYRLDRLTRSVLDLYQLLQDFEKYDVKFKSATEIYDTTTAIGRLFITLVAALAQWERENLAERVKFGQEQMVLEEKRPGGRAPFGYQTYQGQLEINQEEAKIVRMIYDQYVNGQGYEGISISLNESNLRTRLGAEWTKTGIKRILQNPVYYGALRWNYSKGGHKLNHPDEWIIVEDVYPPIIDKEIFNRVQTIIETRSLKHPRELASDFIYSGVLHCARCGEPLNGKTIRMKRRGDSIKYYQCRKAKQKKCDLPLIREDYIEKQCIEIVSQFYNSELAVSAFRESERESEDPTPISLKKQLNKLNQRRKRWQLLFAEGLIDVEECRERIQADLEKEREIQIQLDSFLDTSLPTEQIFPYMQDFPALWRHADVSEKKHLTSLLFKEIIIDMDEILRTSRTKNKVSLCSILFR